MKEKLLAFQQFLRLEKRYSNHTLQSYSTDLSQMVRFLQEQYGLEAWEEVKPFHLRSWLAELVGKELAATTVRRKISSVRSFFRFLEKRYAFSGQVARTLILPKIPRRLPTTIREKDLELLFEQVTFSNDYLGKRDRTILELLYSAGLRRAELIQLGLNDLDFAREHIRVLGKGNKERLIPMTQRLRESLQEYVKVREQEWGNGVVGNLFLTRKGHPLYPRAVYDLVKKYLSQVSDSKKRSPHVLRHSFATHLVDAGADLHAVKELLGHNSLAATQVYTHNTIEKLKRSYALAHPKAVKKKP